MNKKFLITGSLFAALAVALGAFGAHGLEKLTTDDKILKGFQTATQYQLYHALALLAVAIIYEKYPVRSVRLSGDLFIWGIVFFSGSLYLITALKISESDFVKFAGPVTPIGGVFFIAGWILLLLAFIIKKRS